jgi:hypothetical protein
MEEMKRLLAPGAGFEVVLEVSYGIENKEKIQILLR